MKEQSIFQNQYLLAKKQASQNFFKTTHKESGKRTTKNIIDEAMRCGKRGCKQGNEVEILSEITKPFNLSISINPLMQPSNEVSQSLLSIGEEAAKIISENIDYKNPIVKTFATNQIRPVNQGEYSIKQVCDIWDSVNNSWSYFGYTDELTNYKNASTLIEGGLRGNCLNFSVLISALIESIKGTSRIVKTASPDLQWHVYPEVLIGNSASDIRPIIHYVKKRYSLKKGYPIIEVISGGVTNYWLNLDNRQKKPGDFLCDDFGVCYIYYPDGTFKPIINSGYPENFPLFPSNLNKNHASVFNLPYLKNFIIPISGSINDKYTIKILTNDTPINVFIFNQENHAKYLDHSKGNGSAPIIFTAIYSNIINRIFEFIPPANEDYYFVIANHPLTPNSADSKKTATVTLFFYKNR